SAHRLAARRDLERVDPVLHLGAAQAPVVVQVDDVEFAHEVGVAARLGAHDGAVAVGVHGGEVDAVVRRDRVAGVVGDGDVRLRGGARGDVHGRRRYLHLRRRRQRGVVGDLVGDLGVDGGVERGRVGRAGDVFRLVRDPGGVLAHHVTDGSVVGGGIRGLGRAGGQARGDGRLAGVGRGHAGREFGGRAVRGDVRRGIGVGGGVDRGGGVRARGGRGFASGLGFAQGFLLLLGLRQRRRGGAHGGEQGDGKTGVLAGHWGCLADGIAGHACA